MNFETEVDLMAHEATILEADIQMNAYNIPGKPDKRFKSGYRVKPSAGVNPILNFTVERNDRYQISQIWQIGKPNTDEDLGKYCVITLGFNEAKLIPISLSNIKDKPNLKIKNKMKFIYYESMYRGEGSV